MVLEILYEEVIKTFKLEGEKLFRLLKVSGEWREVVIKANTSKGYCCVRWGGNNFLSHRLMYSLYHQVDVDINLVIDHVDGNCINNSYENLRLLSNRGNGGNRVEHREGKLVGCSYDKRRKKWKAKVEINDKRVHLGLFLTETEANEAYLQAVTMLDEGATIKQIQETMDIRTKDKCTSKHKGVYFNKLNRTWRSIIYINKKRIQLGYFPTELEAHEVYLRAKVMIEEGFSVEQIQETFDIKLNGRCTSKYRGVSFYRASGKWLARITVDGKKIYLGYFLTELEAYEAYLKAKAELITSHKQN